MSLTGRPTVLFLCPDNGGLSLLAEAAALRNHPLLRPFSAAAAAPGEVDPALVACLTAEGLSAEGLSAKPATLFALSGAPRLDVVVTLGEEARRAARRLPLFGLLRLEAWRLAEIPPAASKTFRQACYRRLLPEIGAAIARLEERIALSFPGAAA